MGSLICLAPSAVFGYPYLGCNNPSCPECVDRHQLLSVHEATMKGISQRPQPAKSSKPSALLATEETKAPTYKEAGLDETFADLVRERQKKSAKMAVLKAEIADLSGTIMEFLKEAEVDSVTVDGQWGPKIGQNVKEEVSIDLLRKAKVPAAAIAAAALVVDVKALIEAGVAAQTISKCITKTPGEPFVRVDKLGSKGR